MSSLRIASRYAKALFRLADGDLAKAEKQATALDTIQELFAMEESARILRSPVMPAELKRELLKLALDRVGASPDLRNFTNALIGAGRLAMLPQVGEAYRLLLDAARGVLHAEVSSAVELGGAEVGAIQSALKNMLRKEIKIAQRIDKNLLGGFEVRIGNMLVDMSVRTKLDALAAQALA